MEVQLNTLFVITRGAAIRRDHLTLKVMVDNVAMVVSVRNRTVITAVGSDQLKNNVFTNIDSAVIA